MKAYEIVEIDVACWEEDVVANSPVEQADDFGAWDKDWFAANNG